MAAMLARLLAGLVRLGERDAARAKGCGEYDLLHAALLILSNILSRAPLTVRSFRSCGKRKNPAPGALLLPLRRGLNWISHFVVVRSALNNAG
jgi:hypothetical protein